MQKIFTLTNLTLIVALALSAIAAYYSIIGLTAIFAGAVIPVIIMGSILEIGKITTTVWLRKYWKQAGFLLKLYLVPAVFALAILTSMGIFGFLSKAHMDSGVISGDVQAKLSLFDEKIKTERENIELARKALQQMDQQVDARLSRSDSEQAAERAVQIRRQQAIERTKLQKDISDAQNKIAKLNEERAPIAAENRKVEAEVGPIKYVAALLYGDNPDTNLLERAVRWLIILLVIVFDPLAIALVLAANSSREWDKVITEEKYSVSTSTESKIVEEENKLSNENNSVEGITPWPTEWEEFKNEKEVDKFVKEAAEEEVKEIEKKENLSYLKTGFAYPENFQREKPHVYKEEIPNNNVEEKLEKEIVVDKQPDIDLNSVKTATDLQNGYISYEDKTYSKVALQELVPDLFVISADNSTKINSKFGIQFPKIAGKGDIFVRVDMLPNRVFKFDGHKWIEINKENSQTYLHNDEYLKFLVEKIEKGEYDIDSLSDKEKEEIEIYLKGNEK